MRKTHERNAHCHKYAGQSVPWPCLWSPVSGSLEALSLLGRAIDSLSTLFPRFRSGGPQILWLRLRSVDSPESSTSENRLGGAVEEALETFLRVMEKGVDDKRPNRHGESTRHFLDWFVRTCVSSCHIYNKLGSLSFNSWV